MRGSCRFEIETIRKLFSADLCWTPLQPHTGSGQPRLPVPLVPGIIFETHFKSDKCLCQLGDDLNVAFRLRCSILDRSGETLPPPTSMLSSIGSIDRDCQIGVLIEKAFDVCQSSRLVNSIANF